MRNIGRVEQREHIADAQPVIGAKGRALGPDLVAIDLQLDTLGGKVVQHTVIQLADHVDVAMQDHRRRILVPRRARLFHDDIVKRVTVKHQRPRRGKIRNEIRRLLFML
ncbi:hypothetical protein ACFSHQ_26180 [Gemmobacter lanyuensis]